MFLSAAIVSWDSQPMPKAFELAFFSVGFVFLCVDTYRSLAFRREWKRETGERQRGRYRMSESQRIESSLYWLGIIVSWAFSFPDWWLRAFFACLAIAGILGLLYRFNLKAPDTPPYDAGSMLHLKNGQTAPFHKES